MDEKNRPIEVYITTTTHISDQNNDITNFLGKSNYIKIMKTGIYCNLDQMSFFSYFNKCLNYILLS
jgi:hypothetical protein